MTAEAPGAPGATAQAGVLEHRQVMVVLGGLMVGMFLAAIDQTIVATALPTIVEDLGGLDHLSWVVTAYLLASTISTPLYGRISDLYGRRQVFQAAIVLFLAGSALCGVAQSMEQLIACRAVQGLGGGGLISLSFTIIGDVLPPRQRGRYMGYFSAVFATASIAGPLLGGFIVDHLDWRWIFYVNLPTGAVALAVTSKALRLPRARREARVDLVGAALLSAATTCILLVAVWGGETYPWGSRVILGLASAALLLALLFVVVEGKVAEPILPLQLFRIRTVWVSMALATLSGAAMFGVTIFLPLFLQAVVGVSATNSGLLLAPLMLAVTASSTTIGRRVSRTGAYKRYVIIGSAVSFAGIALLATLGDDTGRFTVSLYMVVVGVGMGMSVPVVNLSAQNAVRPADLGATTSSIMFLRTLGGTLGVAAFSAVMLNQLRHGIAGLPGSAGLDVDDLVSGPNQIRALEEPLRGGVVHELAEAIAAGFLTCVPLMVVIVVLSLVLPELPLRTHAEVAPEPAV